MVKATDGQINAIANLLNQPFGWSKFNPDEGFVAWVMDGMSKETASKFISDYLNGDQELCHQIINNKTNL